MRIEEVYQNNKNLPKNVKVNTPEGCQMAILSVLTDISETLAMILDMYGIVHGREIAHKDRRQGDVEQ